MEFWHSGDHPRQSTSSVFLNAMSTRIIAQSPPEHKCAPSGPVGLPSRHCRGAKALKQPPIAQIEMSPAQMTGLEATPAGMPRVCAMTCVGYGRRTMPVPAPLPLACTHYRPAVLRRGASHSRPGRSRMSARLILLAGQRWTGLCLTVWGNRWVFTHLLHHDSQRVSGMDNNVGQGPQGPGPGPNTPRHSSTPCSPTCNRQTRTPPQAASTPVDRSPIPARVDFDPDTGRRIGGGAAKRRSVTANQSDREDG
jgi:hypothetical protein